MDLSPILYHFAPTPNLITFKEDTDTDTGNSNRQKQSNFLKLSPERRFSQYLLIFTGKTG